MKLVKLKNAQNLEDILNHILGRLSELEENHRNLDLEVAALGEVIFDSMPEDHLDS